jgi:hypothetical protein
MQHDNDTGSARLSNGSTTFPGLLMASTSLLPPPQAPEPRSFPSPGRMVNTLQQHIRTYVRIELNEST